MKIIKFNGYGLPDDARVQTGTVVLFVHHPHISVVRVEILPPEQFGPALEHALNDAELEKEARIAFNTSYPNGLSIDRHWILECPIDIAKKSKFKGN